MSVDFLRTPRKAHQWLRGLWLFSSSDIHDAISHNAAISASEKGSQWQQALNLFEVMPRANVSRSVISFSAAIGACEKGGQWQQALNLFEAMPKGKVTPDVIIYNAAISACEKGGNGSRR